jgi:DDB1- and CUL4-associated factor 7
MRHLINNFAATPPHPSSPVKTPFVPQPSYPTSALTVNSTPSTPTASTVSPPLLRLAASPHEGHLLATFAADSNVIRVLDVRQPGTALLELKGHSANVNCVEWAPQRRGCLASGGDDGLVLVWDLLNQATGQVIGASGANGTGSSGTGRATGEAAATVEKTPGATWRCEYEVGNCSWAPNSSLTGQGGEWVGVSGGRGVWGVKL